MKQYKKFIAGFTAAVTGLVMTVGFSSEAADRISAAKLRNTGTKEAWYSILEEVPESVVKATKKAADSAEAQYKEKKRKEEEARKAAEEAELARLEAERIAKEQAEAEQAAAEQEAMQTAAFAASADEQALLAAIIFCEAGNQPYEGQVAVGAVIMNRVRSGVYPNSISEVIYQPGQFGPAMSGWLDSVLAGAGYTDTAWQAAADALSGSNPIGECLYFGCGDYGIQIGDHFFH